MTNQHDNEQSPQNKKFYIESMIVGMLLAVALVMGTPLFNSFVKEPQNPQDNNRLNAGVGVSLPAAGLQPRNTGGSTW